MSRKKPTIVEQLRKAIATAEKRGVTRYEIAKATGIAQATLSRFVNEENRGIGLEKAEKIANAIGLDLAFTKRK